MRNDIQLIHHANEYKVLIRQDVFEALVVLFAPFDTICTFTNVQVFGEPMNEDWGFNVVDHYPEQLSDYIGYRYTVIDLIDDESVSVMIKEFNTFVDLVYRLMPDQTQYTKLA